MGKGWTRKSKRRIFALPITQACSTSTCQTAVFIGCCSTRAFDQAKQVRLSILFWSQKACFLLKNYFSKTCINQLAFWCFGLAPTALTQQTEALIAPAYSNDPHLCASEINIGAWPTPRSGISFNALPIHLIFQRMPATSWRSKAIPHACGSASADAINEDSEAAKTKKVFL